LLFAHSEFVNKTYSRTEENIDSHVNTAYDNIVNNETNVQTALISQAPPFESDDKQIQNVQRAIFSEDTNAHFTTYNTKNEPLKKQKKREDQCASVPKADLIVYPCGRVKNYKEVSKREDLCAVRPEVMQQTTGEMYKLRLDEVDKLEGRYVRAFENGQVKTVYTKGTLFEAIDSAIEKTGLVPEYIKNEDGVYLAGISGLQNASYIIKVTNKQTGERRYIRESIDKVRFDPDLEELAIELFKFRRTDINHDEVFDKRYFSRIIGANGQEVEGGAELFSYIISEAEANDNSYTILEEKTNDGRIIKKRLRKNSLEYLNHIKAKEAGIESIYAVYEVFKEGKKIGTDTMLERYEKNGQVVMKFRKDGGYLTEFVDKLGQRSEPLAADGVTALANKDAIGKAGQRVSVIGMIQGMYNRIETLKNSADYLRPAA
jgi:hypothetical protein